LWQGFWRLQILRALVSNCRSSKAITAQSGGVSSKEAHRPIVT
jgi:hypothetical protein